MLLSDFISEVHEIVREARISCAVDGRGRNVELYYRDMLRRLEDAVDAVNERITARGGFLLKDTPGDRP